MRYQIKYLPLANRDILAIADYLDRFSDTAAGKLLGKMKNLIGYLSEQPFLWEVYQDDPYYRRIVLEKYLVFYHVNESEGIVEIHRVLYGARNLPSVLGKD